MSCIVDGDCFVSGCTLLCRIQENIASHAFRINKRNSSDIAHPLRRWDGPAAKVYALCARQCPVCQIPSDGVVHDCQHCSQCAGATVDHFYQSPSSRAIGVACCVSRLRFMGAATARQEPCFCLRKPKFVPPQVFKSLIIMAIGHLMSCSPSSSWQLP